MKEARSGKPNHHWCSCCLDFPISCPPSLYNHNAACKSDLKAAYLGRKSDTHFSGAPTFEPIWANSSNHRLNAGTEVGYKSYWQALTGRNSRSPLTENVSWFEWYCLILYAVSHGIALYRMILNGTAWYWMALQGIARLAPDHRGWLLQKSSFRHRCSKVIIDRRQCRQGTSSQYQNSYLDLAVWYWDECHNPLWAAAESLKGLSSLETGRN